ncbi:hypothetical protein HC141_01885 [Lactobacillus mulieris]|uniref:hypothetical protein n=1 Tax=Lactobacillus mulieris TaxID=2508708 RepID=UPI0014329A30|nr:hypothetical protein [Lactobacillus mulieris]MDK6563573.1 hypothetical protein [Lactobacillus mulieris]MDK8082183.1 hypothetical protein [Lactobacillus mulieris]NKC42697.1 hypothetical protein [Lactobacillus mulieris]
MRPNELRNFFKKYSEVLKDRYNVTDLNVNDWKYANNTYYLEDGWPLYSLTFEYDCVSLNNEDGSTITTFEWSNKLNKLMNFIHDNNDELYKIFPYFTSNIDEWELHEPNTWVANGGWELIQFCKNNVVAIMLYDDSIPEGFPEFITTIEWSDSDE